MAEENANGNGDQETKTVSKTGVTAVISGIFGLGVVLFPRVFQDLPQDEAIKIVGAISVLFSAAIAIFRKISDGKKPKII